MRAAGGRRSCTSHRAVIELVKRGSSVRTRQGAQDKGPAHGIEPRVLALSHDHGRATYVPGGGGSTPLPGLADHHPELPRDVLITASRLLRDSRGEILQPTSQRRSRMQLLQISLPHQGTRRARRGARGPALLSPPRSSPAAGRTPDSSG